MSIPRAVIPGPVGATGPPGPPGPAIGVSGRHYLALTAINTGYSTPNNAALQQTTAVSYRTLVTCSNWATGAIQTLIAKWGTTSPNKTDKFAINTDGKLRVSFSDGSNTPVLPASVTMQSLALAANDPVWLRADLLSNVAGQSQATFYYSYDKATWTQIGAVATNATPGPFAVNTTLVTIGQESAGANPATAVRLYVAEIWDGTPSLVARFDARNLTTPSDYTDTSGSYSAPWTHMASAAVYQDTLNGQDFLAASLAPQAIDPGLSGDSIGTDPTGVVRNRRATEFNLKHQGAQGDGATNDTAVIIAACADPRPKVVPDGVYMVNPDSLIISQRSDSWRGGGFDFRGGDPGSQQYGSIFTAAVSGTHLATTTQPQVSLSQIGFDGAQLCSGDVLRIDGADNFLDLICTTNPLGGGNSTHITVNGDRVMAQRHYFCGNSVANTVGLMIEGADGKYDLLKGANAEYLVKVRSGGTQMGIFHGSIDPTSGVGAYHMVIACTKFFLLHGEFDNPLAAHIYLDPASAFSGGATMDTIVLGLHLNLGKTTPDATVPGIKFNTSAGFNMKNGKIRATFRAIPTSRFTYAIDPGSDPTKLKGWDVDINYSNPNAPNGSTLIGPTAWVPDRYRAIYSVDSATNTWGVI